MRVYFVVAAIWAAIVIIDSATGTNYLRASDGYNERVEWEEYRGRR